MNPTAVHPVVNCGTAYPGNFQCLKHGKKFSLFTTLLTKERGHGRGFLEDDVGQRLLVRRTLQRAECTANKPLFGLRNKITQALLADV
jgi:hypothetical protein